MRRSMTFLASDNDRAPALDTSSGTRPHRHARGMRASTAASPYRLTSRELEVLLLLCEGLKNGAIAARLFRSVRTADHHLAAVFAKLGVASRTAAVATALTAGLRPRAAPLGARNLGKLAVAAGAGAGDTACAATSCR
jgi:DNA-binding NarL/FixJ family response regulator